MTDEEIIRELTLRLKQYMNLVHREGIGTVRKVPYPDVAWTTAYELRKRSQEVLEKSDQRGVDSDTGRG